MRYFLILSILILSIILLFACGTDNKTIKLKEGEVYNPVTDRIWMDRNLGASRVAISSSDPQAYGDLYQWGRAADGHQIISRFDGDGKTTSSTTNTISSVDQPGHGDFILTGSGWYNWRKPHNNSLWQGVNGINNPCPTGYRIPTVDEWIAERESWNPRNNSDGAFNSPLKLTFTYFRSQHNGSISNIYDESGRYWSSNYIDQPVRILQFTSANTGGDGISSLDRAFGASVRCIKD